MDAEEFTDRDRDDLDDEAREASGDQVAWLKMVRDLREQLRKRIPDVCNMRIEEAKMLADTMQVVMNLNEDAAAFDRSTENKKTRLPFGN